MTDKPIIFSAPMIRALREGWKTQTRRVLNPHPSPHVQVHRVGLAWEWRDGTRGGSVRVPYALGDRLWVREAWRADRSWGASPPRDISASARVMYEADAVGNGSRLVWGRHRHARFMPRWASRLTLLVTDVRVQRLQAISRGDAMEEGCPFANMASGPDPREWFAELWDSLHGQGAWDENPWVCAISFTVHHCNIDSAEVNP